MSGQVEAINTSRGGVPKQPVFEAVVTGHGLVGDHQNDTYHHGGPDRAVVLFSLDLIHALQREGHSITAGSVGENLTVSGVDWDRLVPGTLITVGEVELRVTKYATPCTNIRASFLGGDFMRIYQDRYPGWSRVCTRVLKGGVVRPGDPVDVKGEA
jgi:MOSC domain-containing protein YiiM